MKTLIITCFALVSAVAIVGLTGCETESATQAEIVITPKSVYIYQGQSVEFVASGWYEYTWTVNEDVAVPVLGVLATRTGNSTVYTAIASPDGSSETRTLKVVGSGGTNGLLTGYAIITHVGEDEEEGTNAAVLNINASLTP